MIFNIAMLHVVCCKCLYRYKIHCTAYRKTILANPFLSMRLLSALSCFIFCSTSKQLCCYLSISTNKFCNFYDGIINCLL